jgi:hypothetical protein
MRCALKQKSRRAEATVTFGVMEKQTYDADLPSVLMHLAQSVFLTRRPFSMIETFCKFGLNVRLVARRENERL